MPVRPENRHHYQGEKWRVVRANIRDRACTSAAAWLADVQARPGRLCEPQVRVHLELVTELARILRCECEGVCGTDHPGRCLEIDRLPALDFNGTVVLTVAHLDQQPDHNDPANLLALCQRCHNRLDAPHRAIHAAETRTQRTIERDQAAGQVSLLQLAR